MSPFISIPIFIFSLLSSTVYAETHPCVGTFTRDQFTVIKNDSEGDMLTPEDKFIWVCPHDVEVRLIEVPGKGQALARIDLKSGETFEEMAAGLAGEYFNITYDIAQSIIASSYNENLGFYKDKYKGELNAKGGFARHIEPQIVGSYKTFIQTNCEAGRMDIRYTYKDWANDNEITCSYSRK